METWFIFSYHNRFWKSTGSISFGEDEITLVMGEQSHDADLQRALLYHILHGAGTDEGRGKGVHTQSFQQSGLSLVNRLGIVGKVLFLRLCTKHEIR